MKDLRHVRIKGCGRLGSSSKNHTGKRVVRCSVCREEGHNCRNYPKNHKDDMYDDLEDDYEEEYDFFEGDEWESEHEGDEGENEGDKGEGEGDDDEMVRNLLIFF